jgi:hypothetical protein
MSVVDDRDVVIAIRRLVEGQLTVDAFENQFVAAMWDQTDTPLVRAVTMILAESSGNVGDDVAVEQLRALVENVTLVSNDWITVGSANGVTVSTTMTSSTIPAGAGSHN